LPGSTPEEVTQRFADNPEACFEIYPLAELLEKEFRGEFYTGVRLIGSLPGELSTYRQNCTLTKSSYPLPGKRLCDTIKQRSRHRARLHDNSNHPPSVAMKPETQICETDQV
jgi:hypothetical protein